VLTFGGWERDGFNCWLESTMSRDCVGAISEDLGPPIFEILAPQFF